MLIELVLAAQVARRSARNTGRVSFWQQHTGVSIGLACGAQLANCYLRAMDLKVQSSFNSIRVYIRYIDDVLIISTEDIIQQVLVMFNAFDDHISISHDEAEGLHSKRVSFLDLDIELLPAGIRYGTYRKPLATFCYLPFESCHSIQCKSAVIHTELIRLARTCSNEDKFDAEALFTLSRFRERGYPIELLRKITCTCLLRYRMVLVRRLPCPGKFVEITGNIAV